MLLIEDFAPLARSVAQGLREAGYAVDAAADGEEPEHQTDALSGQEDQDTEQPAG